jgi:hypothetical protein
MDWSLSCILGIVTTFLGSLALGCLICEVSNTQIFSSLAIMFYL